MEVRVVWENTYFGDAKLLGDTWERAYGDMEWKSVSDSGKMPWYFMVYENGKTAGFGVKTGPNALCYWEASKEEITRMIMESNQVFYEELESDIQDLTFNILKLKFPSFDMSTKTLFL